MALTGVENIYFPKMRDWIKEHIELAAKNKVVTSKTQENMLLADVIQVLNLLVKYGYYDDPDDVKNVLVPLLDVLNGFTDQPFPDVSGEWLLCAQNVEGAVMHSGLGLLRCLIKCCDKEKSTCKNCLESLAKNSDVDQ